MNGFELDNLLEINTPDGKILISITFCEIDNKYHYINLTKNHICPWGFDTVEDAKNNLKEYIKSGEINKTASKPDQVDLIIEDTGDYDYGYYTITSTKNNNSLRYQRNPNHGYLGIDEVIDILNLAGVKYSLTGGLWGSG